jgi:small subunit ribosomal protein S6
MINKESEGYYVLFNFTSNADFPAELDRRYKITDGVLRTLIIKKDEE